MDHYLEIFDRELKRVAYFDTASDVVEKRKINAVSTLTFSLPAIDEKITLCRLRHFCSVNGGDLYRIIDRKVKKDDVTMIEFECEHVLATLCDDVMFKDHIVGNIGTYTDEVIEYILSFQLTKRWELVRCDFDRQFEYGWTSENLLSALFSVTDPFTAPYMWVTDTTSYPWKLSLVEIDMEQNPQFYIMDGLNWRASQQHEQSSTIFTRIYPQGYGEGINQLGIADINGGVPYVEADQEAIDEYGIIQAVWTDRRYTNAESLLEAAKAMVADLSKPYYQYKIDLADVYNLTGDELYRAEVGKIVKFDDGFKTIITDVTRRYDEDGDITVSVANKTQTIATSLADLADRQRIETTYSQGATQLWGSPLMGNATTSEAFTYPLWIPDETKIINKIMAKIQLGPFQSYSRTTTSGGGSSQTSSSGGGTSSSTASNSTTSQTSGASSRTTTASGGQTTSGAATNVLYNSYNTTTPNRSTFDDHTHSVRIGVPSHTHSIGSHTHGMDHTHNFSLPSHTHSFSVPSHTHSVSIPAHTHGIESGIFYASSRPTSAQVLVNNTYAFTVDTDWEGEITEYLIGEDGLIPRGRWIEISVVPDLPAFVKCSIAAQGFIQSTGGGQY